VRRQQLLGIGLISAVLGGSLIASAQNQPASPPTQPTEQTQPAASPPSSVQPATTATPADGDQSQPTATPQSESPGQPQAQPQTQTQPSAQPPSPTAPQHTGQKADAAKAEGAKSDASKAEGAAAKSDATKTAADSSKAVHAHTTHPGAAGATASGNPTPAGQAAGAGQSGGSAGGAQQGQAVGSAAGAQQGQAGGSAGGTQQTQAAAAARAAAAVRAAPTAFSFASVERLAQDRASKPYRNRSSQLPEGIAKLTFDEYRDIRFQRTSSLWYDKALFEVQFLHRGFNFDRRVNISEVSGGVARPVLYNPAMFDFGPRVPKIAFPPDLGFAGFRIHYPLNTPAYKDELIVFLGASYFRVLGRNQVYGLSARGLAIDTGSASGEEFPYFTDFWLLKPEPTARAMTLFALLDSPGITGAYQFDIRPGTSTQVQVTAELYPRRQIAKLGIAPLTSMFFYGENSNNHHLDDYRPEVHDSDGLMTERGTGEWMWRPLVNPKDLRMNRFMDEHPRSFSLVQRDRDFNHYQDNEARYERRPSYHLEPLGDWGKGGVELVEIPSDEEIHDNIVAYWVPDAPVQPNKPMTFSYLLSAYTGTTQWPPGGKVIATHFSRIVNGTTVVPNVRRVIVDFAGGDLDTLAGAQPVQAQASATGGEIDEITVERLAANGVWRVTMRMKTNDKPVDLRCYLTLYGEALTETWTYLWAPGA